MPVDGATLSAIVSEIYTVDACGARVTFSHDLRGPTLIVQDAQPKSDSNSTFWPLKLPTAFEDDGTFIDYLDAQIRAAVEAHKQPYKRYPETTATDEMAYLAR